MEKTTTKDREVAHEQAHRYINTYEKVHTIYCKYIYGNIHMICI